MLQVKHKFQLGRVTTITLPFIISILFLLFNTLKLHGFTINIFGYIGSINLLLILYLYLNSFIYSLCAHHRMFIHYLLVSWILCVYDVYFGIPITDKSLLISHYLIFGLAVVLYGILKFKENKK